MKIRVLVAGLALGLMLGPISAEARGGYGGHHGRGHYGGHGSHFGGYFGGYGFGGSYGGRRSHFSFNLGSPYLWGARHYYQPYVYAPAPVVIQQQPQVYVQQQPVQYAPPVVVAPVQAATLWYYCPQPAGYYPHVETCTQSWVGVDPASVQQR